MPQDHPLRPIRRMADAALVALSLRFAEMYAHTGRPSLAPEKLLRALLLQLLDSMRSERMRMEQLDYNLLFRWFVGLNLDEAIWDATSFSKNRERLLGGDIAAAFCAAVVAQTRQARPLSDESFTVDGTLLEDWSGQKSLRPVDEQQPRPPRGGRNPEVNCHGQTRRNDTRVSWTGPEARPARKSQGGETKLAWRGHLLTENRHGLVLGAQGAQAYGNAETHAALQLPGQVPGRRWLTVDADRGCNKQFFAEECHRLRLVAHVAARKTGSAVDPELIPLAGYQFSQRKLLAAHA